MTSITLPALLRQEKFLDRPGGRGSRGGTSTTRSRVFVDTDASGTLRAPEYFAPGTEHCLIEYSYSRRGEAAGAEVRLTIKDKDDTVIFESGVLGLAADRTATHDWDGKDAAGNLVTIFKSPFTVTLKVGSFSIGRQVKVEILAIPIWWRGDNPRVYMNRPEGADEKLEVIATVQIKKSDGTAARVATPTEVSWSFSDPGDPNTPKDKSVGYAAGRFLGKGEDPAAIFWEAHPGSTSVGDPDFKLKCKTTTVASGADMGKAKVFFRPGAVGGDSYTLKAKVLRPDSSELFAFESGVFTIWRKLVFTPYFMTGRTAISRYGAPATMNAFYVESTYVEYDLGRVTEITAPKACRYFCLWDHATSRQLDWPAHAAKIAAETPTADELAKARGPAGADRTAARAAIRAKAQAWHDRLMAQFYRGLRTWQTDAGIPNHSAVAVEFSHPKTDGDAPAADSTTSLWGGMPWLYITHDGSDVSPDSRWEEVQGFVDPGTGNAFIFDAMGAARTKVVIAHESAHASKEQFHRLTFDAGAAGVTPDHNPEPGLMDPYGSRSAFTDREKKIIRGKILV